MRSFAEHDSAVSAGIMTECAPARPERWSFGREAKFRHNWFIYTLFLHIVQEIVVYV